MNVHPLSNAQTRIWFTQKKYENSSLFNIGGMVKINGNVNIIALKQAISNTVLQNPALKLRLIEKIIRFINIYPLNRVWLILLIFLLKKKPL